MKKTALILAAFAVGFFVHAFLFPDFLSRTSTFDSSKSNVLGEKDKAKEEIRALTIVEFNNGKFKPSKVWIKKGYYIGIRNMDNEKQMWLLSEEPSLRTVRGYAIGEQVKSIMPIEGSYIVYDKNTEEKLVIVVQP